MTFRLQQLFFALAVLLVLSPSGFASTKLYVSNNSSVISIEEAFDRLQSPTQVKLIHDTIPVLQKSHIEQGQFENVLGVYQMSSNQQTTADNTIRFEFSPYQNLGKKQLSTIAKHLSNKLNQDSVMVSSTNKNSKNIIFRTVMFNQSKPKLASVIRKIQENLSPTYQLAYSIYLDSNTKRYANTRVNKVEWMGTHFSSQELTAVFHHATIQEQRGYAWLVFNNGKIENL